MPTKNLGGVMVNRNGTNNLKKYLKILTKRKTAIMGKQDLQNLSGYSKLLMQGEYYGLDFAARMANTMLGKHK